MEENRRIALLFGGASPEHEISIKSAAEVAAALDGLGTWLTTPIYISREGRWRWSRPAAGTTAAELARAAADPAETARRYEPAELDFAQALLHLVVNDYAAVVIIMHGANGEDGRLQGAFELAGIRFTGSGSAASALAMDKTRCQAFLTSRGLPTPAFLPLQRGWICNAEAAKMIRERLGLPCVIKPALCGSSVGLTIVEREADLEAALERAYGFCPTLQAERFIRGDEFTCGVLDFDGGPRALPVTQIIPPEGRFFDYDAKYTPGVSRELTPAPIAPELAERIQSLAVEAHRSVGCEGFSRVDFMVGAEGPVILEINTIPGMTRTSLLPQAAAAAGINMGALVEMFIHHALAPSV